MIDFFTPIDTGSQYKINTKNTQMQNSFSTWKMKSNTYLQRSWSGNLLASSWWTRVYGSLWKEVLNFQAQTGAVSHKFQRIGKEAGNSVKDNARTSGTRSESTFPALGSLLYWWRCHRGYSTMQAYIVAIKRMLILAVKMGIKIRQHRKLLIVVLRAITCSDPSPAIE